MSLTPYGRHTILRCALTTDVFPATLYVALTTSVPGTSDSGDLLAAIEPPATTNYSRIAYATSNGFDFSTYGEVTNSRPVTFTTPATDWGMLRGWALCDAATSGMVLMNGPLRQSRRASAGTALIIGISALRAVLR